MSELIENRKIILFVELAGLFHDIGKLSSKFLNYRQHWQKEGGDDPHADGYFSNGYETEEYPEAFKLKIENSGSCLGGTDFSIEKAVNEHHDRKSTSELMALLKLADKNDSAVDRNNPLYSAEQTSEKGPIYASTVFGHEWPLGELGEQDQARIKLYEALCPLLEKYLCGGKCFQPDTRDEIFQAVQNAFEKGLADTNRPGNDTTLWEHSYAVASILKILAIHNIYHGTEKVQEAKDVVYGIWGIGWDGMQFLSYGQKIGDITQRKKIIGSIQGKIKRLVENEIPIGNTIYEDDNGIYFIVPANFMPIIKEDAENTTEHAVYKKDFTEIKNKIQSITAKESNAELQASFAGKAMCRQLTAIINVIEKLETKTGFRFNNTEDDSDFDQNFNKEFLSQSDDSKEVCSICRLRPVGSALDKDNNKICSICNTRRSDASSDNKKDNSGQTIFIDEIVDKNQRAALIIGRFELKQWLNGEMVRSLFVTEPKGIENEIKSLGSILDFSKNGKELEVREKLVDLEYDYHRIVEDIDALLKDGPLSETARNTAFLYVHGRGKIVPANVPVREGDPDPKGDLEKFIEQIRKVANKEYEEKIWKYNFINAKSPTPSTLLDVWRTTKKFFKFHAVGAIAESLTTFQRIAIKLDREPIIQKRGSYKAEIDGIKVEILFTEGNNANLIATEATRKIIAKLPDHAKKNRLIITDKNFDQSDNKFRVKIIAASGTKYYRPYRIITASPYLFMAIVPADKAIDISNEIFQNYQWQFGKVTGRLPFSIGNIFFKRRMPMFVVLDSARRMLRNFEDASSSKDIFEVEKNIFKSGNLIDINLKTNGKTIKWNIPATLGNCDEDRYHAYALLNKDHTASGRKGYFKTIVGDVIPFGELEKGDKLKCHPNYYDFIFLDSNQKRHEILKKPKDQKKILLEELNQKIIHIWNDIINGGGFAGITQAKLKNIQTLWEMKYQSWGGDNPEFEKLVKATLSQDFPRIQKKYKVLILETVKNGLFFNLLQLQLGVLKNKVHDKD